MATKSLLDKWEDAVNRQAQQDEEAIEDAQEDTSEAIEDALIIRDSLKRR